MSKLDDLKQKLNKNKPKKIKFAGLDVAIENFPGSLRKWIGPDGKPRVTVVKNSYGFLTKHIGEDGDELDVYLGSNPNAKEVYAINQNNPKTGMLDEQKVMLGFDSPEEAKAVYLSHYNRPDFYRSTTTIPFDTFKGMLTDAKPGSLKWKKKNKRDLKTQAIFSSDTENFDDPNEHWITVGGKRTEEGKHVGGSHIEIKGDEVEKGPPDLKNKPIDDLKSKMNKDQPNTIQDVGKFLGGMGKAASDGFIDTMWNKVQAGQSIPRMGQLENKLRDLQKTGALKSREDISKVIDEHFNPKQNSPINDLKSKMSSKITPGVPQFGKPKPSSAPAPKIIPNSQYDLKTGKQINSQPTSQNVEAKPITPPIEHPFYDKKTGTTAKTDEQNNETKWWNKPNQASDPNKLNPVQQGQKNIENDKGSQSVMRNSHDLKNFGWGKMAQAGNANADKINELAASKGITANDAQKMLSERGNNSPQLSQQNLPSKNNSGTSGSAPINQIEENPTPSSVNPPQEQLQPNIGAPKGPINDKPTKNSPESSLFYPSGKFFPPSESKAPVNAPQAPQSQQELLSDKPESGVQRITPNDFAKEWDSVEGWAGARDNPEHAENIAKGLNQLGDREHAVMQHSNGKHIIVSRPKQNQPTSNIGQSTQGLGQNQLSQTPPEQIQPNTQIPSEEIQDQLGETGAATPAINSPVNPNEIKQQNNKVASQEPLFDGPKTPAQQPLSEEKEPDNVEAKQEIEQNPNPENSQIESPQNNIEQETDSGIREENPEINKNEQRNNSNENINPPTESTKTNPSNQVGESEGENRSSESKSQTIPRTQPNPEKLNEQTKEKPTPQSSNSNNLQDKNENKNQEKTEEKSSKSSPESHKEMGKEKQDVGPSNSPQEEVKPASTSVETPKSNEIDKNWYGENGVKNLLKDARSGNESAIKEARSRGLAEYRTPQPKPRTYKPKWTSDEPRGTLSPEETEKQFNDIDNELIKFGFTKKESPSGSRYYENKNGQKIRVSDHDPNEATKQWIDREDVEEIRGNKRGAIDRVKDLIGENWSEQPVDISKQLGLYAKDKEGNPAEVGEKTGQSNLFNPNKYKGEEKPKEEKVAPQFRPEHTQEMFPNKEQSLPKEEHQEKSPHEMSPDEYEKSGHKVFKTSRGSIYSYNNGKSTRIKSQHAGHEKSDTGLKEKSEQTHFADPKSAQELGMWNSLEASKKQAIQRGDELLLTSINSKTGKRGLDGRIKLSNEPKSGLSPIELWGKSQEGNDTVWKSNHPGNQITEINRPTAESHSQFVNAAKQKSPVDKLKEKMNPDKTGQENTTSQPKNEEKKPNADKPGQNKPSPIDQLKDKMQKNKGSDYDVDENDGYVEVKRNGEVIASGVRQADGKIGDIQYKHPVHQKLNAIRNAVQRAINEHQEKQI